MSCGEIGFGVFVIIILAIGWEQWLNYRLQLERLRNRKKELNGHDQHRD